MKKLEVCKTCPFNSANKKTKKTKKEHLFITLNKLLNRLFNVSRGKEEDICLECGCDILFKTSDEVDEELQCKRWK